MAHERLKYCERAPSGYCMHLYFILTEKEEREEGRQEQRRQTSSIGR
jgi:hypothetical protein